MSYLTPRETQILTLMASGDNYKEVCEKLKIKRPTVKFHIMNARIRLEAETIKHAVAISVRNGLIKI
jgi:DNA-binding CsgD family transcriptional regulator